MTTLCLNMIVRNEAHVIAETLACVAPYIDRWVIVDTGSTDETIAVIEECFARAEIPGELHRRPWRSFGENRSEALQLCAGQTDYAWVIDADDLIVGQLVLPEELEHDSYLLKFGADFRYWRPQIFRNDGSWRYVGVVHEYPTCGRDDATSARIEGDYYLDSRRLGDRNRAADKYQRDAALLLADLERDPQNPRTVFYLAQSYFDAGEHALALERYRQRAEMGDFPEEVYYSLARVGACLEQLGGAWPEVLECFLLAHEQRPSRAEPLCWIAQHYRHEGKFQLAYSFARLASEIPYPEHEGLFVQKDVYDFRAADERAIAAFYVGRHRESYELCRELLAGELPSEAERARITGNRDFAVEQIKDRTLEYPTERVAALTRRLRRRRGAGKARCKVTLTITACKRLELFCGTVSSFLNCCTDVERIGRLICIDDGSSDADRAAMAERFPFFEFVFKEPAERGHARSMNTLLELVQSPRWLHLEDDWHFFDERPYVGQALEILADDRRLGQVLFNRNYGEALTCRDLVGGRVKHTRKSGLRYRLHEHIERDTEAYRAFFAELPEGSVGNVYWPHYSLRPSLLRTGAVRKLGGYDPSASHFELELAERYAAAGLRSAFFDEITCLHTGRRTWERGDNARPNAYTLNQQAQF